MPDEPMTATEVQERFDEYWKWKRPELEATADKFWGPILDRMLVAVKKLLPPEDAP